MTKLLELAEPSACKLPRAISEGDVVYLGEGITWQVSADLARSLNRIRFRRGAALRSLNASKGRV